MPGRSWPSTRSAGGSGAADTVEYWKSAPRTRCRSWRLRGQAALRDAASPIAAATADIAARPRGGDGLLDPEALAPYDELDPGNARLRRSRADVLETGLATPLDASVDSRTTTPRGPYKAPAVRSIHEATDLLLVDSRPAGSRKRPLVWGGATDDARASTHAPATPRRRDESSGRFSSSVERTAKQAR